MLWWVTLVYTTYLFLAKLNLFWFHKSKIDEKLPPRGVLRAQTGAKRRLRRRSDPLVGAGSSPWTPGSPPTRSWSFWRASLLSAAAWWPRWCSVCPRATSPSEPGWNWTDWSKHKQTQQRIFLKRGRSDLNSAEETVQKRRRSRRRRTGCCCNMFF